MRCNFPSLPAAVILAIALAPLHAADTATNSPTDSPTTCATTCATTSPTTIPTDAAPQRIVSLSPAMSRSLVELGLGDRIVGVAEHDHAAPPGLPVVGNYLSPNIERLIALRPTHVVMMAGKEGAHPRLRQLADQGQFRFVSFPAPADVPGVLRLLHDPDALDLGDALGVSDRAAALAATIRHRLEQLAALTAEGTAESTADALHPRVLLAFSTSPVWASGPGSVEHDLLRCVGAVNVLADVPRAAMVLDREKLMALSPPVIVLMMPGSPPLGPLDQDARLAAFRGLGLPAMRDGRVVLVNDPLTLLAQSAAVDDIAAALARAIHPPLTERIDALMADEHANPVNECEQAPDDAEPDA
jgi:ABC-type Fe3+-hydroxamate transport system substrate-binding protein